MRYTSLITSIAVCAFIALSFVGPLTDSKANDLPNINAPTLGGKQFWRDTYLHAGWRIQENVLTGHSRLLDPENVRHAWGDYSDARTAFEKIRVEQGIKPTSSHLIMLVHGILPGINPFVDMQQTLRDQGFDATMISYPSTQDTIEKHADTLALLLRNLEGTKTISFVTHSMGGLVVRHLLGTKRAWQQNIEVDRVVMVAPPNQGSAIARALKDNAAYKFVYGVSGQQLTPEAAQSVPALDVPFIIIAGGRSDSAGYNPLLDGDNDGTVTVKETYLNNAENTYVVQDLHTAIGDNPRTISITLDYLKASKFLRGEQTTSRANQVK